MLRRGIKTIIVCLFKLLNGRILVKTGINVSLSLGFILNKGRGNSIIIDENVSLRHCRFVFKGSKNKIIIHKNARLKNVTFWMEDDENIIEIGANTTTNGALSLGACEGTSICIGEDCMFSHDINVRTTDSHSILNESGERINKATSINIGNHVWVGMQSLILKGADIPHGCIVGARSLVTKKQFHVNSLIVGSPAKSIKENIHWLRERIK